METHLEPVSNHLDWNWPIVDHTSEVHIEDLVILGCPLVSIHSMRPASCLSTICNLDHPAS